MLKWYGDAPLTPDDEKLPDLPAKPVRRLIILVGLLTAIVVWFKHHIGNWQLPTLVCGTYATFFTYLMNAMGERAQRPFKKFIQKAARPALRFGLATWTLRVLAVAVLLVLLFVSTVVVNSGTRAGLTSVSLRSGNCEFEEKRLDGTGDEVRYRFILTHPIGRGLTLAASGYLDQPFRLYPLIPARFQVSRDLAELPTVLVRFPPGSLMHLVDGYLEVMVDGDAVIQTRTSGDHASFMLGLRRELPGDRDVRWGAQLDNAGIREPLRGRIVGRWKSFLQLSTPVALKPGQRIDAVLFSTASREVIVGRLKNFAVGTDGFQDVRMADE